MTAQAEPARLPLPGGSENATVRLHPLLTGEHRVPGPLLHRSGGVLAPLRAIGVGVPKSKRVWIPAPAFLIEHPGAGPLLVDTGLHPDSETDPGSVMGRVASRMYDYRGTTGRALNSQIEARGIDPVDLGLLVMTHLDTDHASGISEFPGRTVLVDEREWRAASSPLAFKDGYHRPHIDQPVAWRTLDFESDLASPHGSFQRTIDLFGDGSVRLVSTPGHTVGHLSVLLRLSDRDALIAGDAAYTTEALTEGALSGPDPWGAQGFRALAQPGPLAPYRVAGDAGDSRPRRQRVGGARAALRLADRLLRQPGGFEGFGFVQEALHPHDFPTAKGDENEIREIDIESTRSALAALYGAYEDRVARLPRLSRLYRDRWFVLLHEPERVLPDPVLAYEDAPVGEVAGNHQHRVGREGADACSKVSSRPCFEHSPSGLHVLLRHRLLRESGGFDGFLPVAVIPELRDEPVSETRHYREGHLSLNAAAPTSDAESAERQHPVFAIADVGKVHVAARVVLSQIREPLDHALVPHVASLQRRLLGLELDRGIHDPKKSPQVF